MSEFELALREVATTVAALHADDVDRDARFPIESITALRERGALSALVPAELGGGGLTFSDIAAGCFELGRGCAASAMVFAMHQIQVHSIVRHMGDDPWFSDYLRRLAAEQRLIASATSEVGTGGDMGSSVAAFEGTGFTKQAPVVSYGAHADDLFTTLRRNADAEPGDQVIVLTHADQNTMEPMGTWDPIGMRGTCSPGFRVTAVCAPEQVLPAAFADIAVQSMVPASHILWSHLWLGLATDAFERARAFVRAAAKRSGGQTPPAAHRLSHVFSELSLLRSQVSSALTEYVAADAESLGTMVARLRINNLKIAASEQTVRVCQGALNVSGIGGFRNGNEYSLGRHVRDSMSTPLMVANERIHETNASLLLIAKDV